MMVDGWTTIDIRFGLTVGCWGWLGKANGVVWNGRMNVSLSGFGYKK